MFEINKYPNSYCNDSDLEEEVFNWELMRTLSPSPHENAVSSDNGYRKGSHFQSLVARVVGGWMDIAHLC